jgi:hypothetical protein
VKILKHLRDICEQQNKIELTPSDERYIKTGEAKLIYRGRKIFAVQLFSLSAMTHFSNGIVTRTTPITNDIRFFTIRSINGECVTYSSKDSMTWFISGNIRHVIFNNEYVESKIVMKLINQSSQKINEHTNTKRYQKKIKIDTDNNRIKIPGKYQRKINNGNMGSKPRHRRRCS